MIKFETKTDGDKVLVSFEIEGGVMSHQEMRDIIPPKVPGDMVVILSGRGSIWLYGFLVNFYSTAKAVAIYQPALGACFVIRSNCWWYKEGDIIKLKKRGWQYGNKDKRRGRSHFCPF